MLVGLVSYDRLSVREYPAIDPPVITVETTYPGASAAIVETQVTKVLEDTLSGIEGIDFITSISRQESSQITVRFQLDRDPDYAAADVRDRVGRVRGRLPDEIEEPIIQKREADAQPILLSRLLQRPALRARDHRLCRPLREGSAPDHCPALPRCACSASGNIRCASGSIRSGSPPSTFRRRTSRWRCAARMSRFRPAASKASSVSSPCCPRPICARRSSSTT